MPCDTQLRCALLCPASSGSQVRWCPFILLVSADCKFCALSETRKSCGCQVQGGSAEGWVAWPQEGLRGCRGAGVQAGHRGGTWTCWAEAGVCSYMPSCSVSLRERILGAVTLCSGRERAGLRQVPEKTDKPAAVLGA